MSSKEKKLEFLANAAIVVVAVLMAVVAGNRFLAQSDPVTELKAGTQIDVPGVDWQANKKTLVLVLQKGCHFCSESAPFYRRLAAALERSEIKPVAVLPNSLEDSRSYLESLGVSIAEIRSARLSSFGVRGTPTLLLIDEKGKLVESWTGKLEPDGEEDVLRKINAASPHDQ